MNSSIEPIKDELERRYKACAPTSYWGFLVYARSYLTFIEQTPTLKNILEYEKNNFQDKIKKRSSGSFGQKMHEDFEVLFWPYGRDLPKIIDEAMETYRELDGVYGKTRLQKFLKYIGIITPQSPKYERRLRSFIDLFHDQLMRRVAECAIKETLEQKLLPTQIKLEDTAIKLHAFNKIYFDKENSILHLNEYKIKMAERKENTYPHQLLNYIFSQEDFYKKVNFYEIMDEAFGDSQNDNLRRCYTAAEAIQDKIIKETNGKIIDFLDIGSGKNGYVKINSKYNPQIT